jgi:hypothetical protein
METPELRTEQWIVDNCNVLYDGNDNGAQYYHPGNVFRYHDSQPIKWTGYLLDGVKGTNSEWANDDGWTCRGYMKDKGYTEPNSILNYYHDKCKWEPLLSNQSILDECKYSFQLCSDWPKWNSYCPIDPYSGEQSKPCSDYINTYPDPVQKPKEAPAICRMWWNNYDTAGRNTAINYMKQNHPEFPEVRDMKLNCTSFKTNVNCMVDPATGTRMTECSHLKSSSNEGNNCRTWLSKLTQEEVDQVINTICVNFPELIECKCVNRGQDPQYQDIKPLTPYPDACWYLPCAGTEPFWVRSTENVASTDSCPSNICQVIVDATAEQNVTIDENYIYFSCDFSEGTGETETVPPSSEWGTLVTDQQLTRFFVLFFTSIGVTILSLL